MADRPGGLSPTLAGAPPNKAYVVNPPGEVAELAPVLG
jgi:hypothetical protein